MAILTKHRVTLQQRANWKQIGFPLHFVGRHSCSFRLATMIEGRVVVSTIGLYRPREAKGDPTVEPLGGPDEYFETYVFNVNGFHQEFGYPLIGTDLAKGYSKNVEEAEALHVKMCQDRQILFNKEAQ